MQQLLVCAAAAFLLLGTARSQTVFVDTPTQARKLVGEAPYISTPACPEEGGKLKLDVVIAPDGSVSRVQEHKTARYFRPDKVLLDMAKAVVSRLKYHPTFRENKPVFVKSYVHVDCKPK